MPTTASGGRAAGVYRVQPARVERILSALGCLADVADVDAYPAAAIAAVDTAVDSDVTTFNEVDLQQRRMVVLTRPADFSYPANAAELLAQHAEKHPLIRHYNETGDGSAYKVSDFLTVDEFRRSHLYRMIYGLIGVEDQMSITLPAPRDHITALVVNRSRRDFNEDDRQALNVLRPYLAQTYRLLRERVRLASLIESARTALDASELHAITLTDPPEEITPGSLVLLYRFFGRPALASALPGRVESWLAKERTKFEAVPGSAPLKDLLAPLVAPRGDQQLAVRVLPQPNGPDVLILRRIAIDEPSAVHLEHLRLTRREAQIVQMLTTGATNAAIGRALYIAPGTVKKHLDNIYRKLGVTNRVAAVKTALELHLGS